MHRLIKCLTQSIANIIIFTKFEVQLPKINLSPPNYGIFEPRLLLRPFLLLFVGHNQNSEDKLDNVKADTAQGLECDFPFYDTPSTIP